MKKSVKQRAVDFAGDRSQGAGHGYPSWEANLIERGYIKGAKDQTEIMYSEEEAGELVYNIIGEYGKHYGIMIDGAKLNELFEQFKNK